MSEPHMIPSVWFLKEFCNWEEPGPMKSVIVDYGFSNCNNPRDRLDLKEAYTMYFVWRDEMELHAACCKGQLYEHVSATRPLDERLQCLMRNPYPLPDGVPIQRVAGLCDRTRC